MYTYKNKSNELGRLMMPGFDKKDIKVKKQHCYNGYIFNITADNENYSYDKSVKVYSDVSVHFEDGFLIFKEKDELVEVI